MTLSWLSIVRLGLVQMALGAVVVLTTSTLNRIMAVELALPAALAGALVALHYGVQLSRPRWGYASDAAGRRTRWIVGGMALLAVGACLAALGVATMERAFAAGLALSVFAYAAIGFGAGACGTSLLALLASGAAPRRRAAAASITWLMMIFGIAATAGGVGAMLDPYSPERLLRIVAIVAALAFVMTGLAVTGIERRLARAAPEPRPVPFLAALAEVWAEPKARAFTVFVFLSMTAYFMQELILEPYAGLVFGFTPGESTGLAGAQNGGVFVGMLLVGVACTGFRIGSLRGWVIAGCLGSAAALAALAGLGPTGPGAPLVAVAVALGFFNGMFAVAAIGAMMALAGEGRSRREGTRMGLWGAAQAVAAGFGGLLGAAAADLARAATGSDAAGFGLVFLAEALLFVAAAAMALRTMERRRALQPILTPGE